MKDLKCRDCPYFWQEDDEERPYCHYVSLGSWDPAPCEQDDEPDDIDSVDYIDKHGVTFFGDREG